MDAGHNDQDELPTFQKEGLPENLTIPCRSQELLQFLSVMYFFLPPFPSPPTSLPSSLTPSCHLFLGLPINLVVPKFIKFLVGKNIFFLRYRSHRHQKFRLSNNVFVCYNISQISSW